MHVSQQPTRIGTHPRGFTLVELLVTIGIIGMMASLILVALYSAQEDAKVARTETQVAKIHELIMSKWEEYETRPVPVDVRRSSNPAFARLKAIREMQRIELPERKSDVIDPPEELVSSAGRNVAALQQAYLRQAQAFTGDNSATVNSWTRDNQGSECLYLIISKMRDNGRSALEFFGEEEIGDTDGDLMPEILDAWGEPIEFLRWAPGFLGLPNSSIQPAAPSLVASGVVLGDMNPAADGNAGDVADPFDMVRADPRWRDYDPNSPKECYKENDPFALYPLIVSAGPDNTFDILMDDSDGTNLIDMRYSRTDSAPYFPFNYGGWESTPAAIQPNDPYMPAPNASDAEGRPVWIGRPSPTREGYVDNISNHTLNVN